MGTSLQGYAKALGRSTAPNPLQEQKEGAYGRGEMPVWLPWLGWVSGWGWGENPAGVGHPMAKPPCPHTTAGGDGAVGTCGQGSLGHSLLPRGVYGESPQ